MAAPNQKTDMQRPNYSRRSKNYLGNTYDNVHRYLDAFLIQGNIHLVYNLGEEYEYITIESVEKIKSNPEKFMFTPFIEFVDI